MEKKKTILIMIYSEINRHPRVLKQISALKDKYRLICAGFSRGNVKDIEFIDITGLIYPKYLTVDFHYKYPAPLRKLISLLVLLALPVIRLMKRYYHNNFIPRKLYRRLKKLSFDLIISHQPELLPLSFKLANGKVPVTFNAHEYYPLMFEDDPVWMEKSKPDIDRLLRQFLPSLSGMLTVSEGIASKYKEVFSVNPVVITNCKVFYDLHPVPVDPSRIRIIHHGSAIRARYLDQILGMIDFLPENYHFYAMLFPQDQAYLDELKARFGSHPRMHFKNIVPTEQIPFEINQYDIGVHALPISSFNNRMALPNKFFEFIQARLAMVLGPTPEMAAQLKKYDLGAVAEECTAESMAKAVLSMSPEKISYHKNMAHSSARAFSAEREEKIIREMVDDLIAHPDKKLI